MKRSISLWAPLVLWCSLIFYLSSLPNLKTDLGVWDTVLRKGAHITEYAVLFIFARRAVRGSFTVGSSRSTLLAAVFSVVYACSDEFHQSFVPGRGPSLVDVSIDSAGAALGYLACLTAGKKKEAKR